MVPTTDTPIRPALRAPWGADADAPGVPLVLARLDDAVSRYATLAPRFVAREESVEDAFAAAREAVEEAAREAVVVALIVGGPELAARVDEGLRDAIREVEASALAVARPPA